MITILTRSRAVPITLSKTSRPSYRALACAAMIAILTRSCAVPITLSKTARPSYRTLVCAAMIANLVKRIHTPMLSHTAPLFANAVLDPITGQEQTYRRLINNPDTAPVWIHGCAKEIGRLDQGLAGTNINGTGTMWFKPHNTLPPGRTATYLRIVVDNCPQKAEPERVCWMVGGNLVDYPGNVSTPTADMTTAKLIMNDTVSTPNATYHCFDISNPSYFDK